ncbi:MAG: hypothetical protein JXR37_15910 [Kiritimatiellae bacterium]|nr:hypothetical protein [Kiritimatiellia bacterium]
MFSGKFLDAKGAPLPVADRYPDAWGCLVEVGQDYVDPQDLKIQNSAGCGLVFINCASNRCANAHTDLLHKEDITLHKNTHHILTDASRRRIGTGYDAW